MGKACGPNGTIGDPVSGSGNPVRSRRLFGHPICPELALGEIVIALKRQADDPVEASLLRIPTLWKHAQAS